MRNDAPGSCWFLENGKCRIYNSRFSGCHIYPHMLRRGTDTKGRVTWLKFACKNKHGQYNPPLPLDECLALAREVKEYENAFLNQQISFLERIHEYFTAYNLRHDPDAHKHRMQQYRQGRPVTIRVFHDGEFEDCRIAQTT